MIPSDLTTEAKLKWQRECYGCTQDELIENIRVNLRFVENPSQLIASMLSDVQEMLELTKSHDESTRDRYREMARQTLNRAKFILFNPDSMQVLTH
jgi:hypothetical protein